MMFSPDEAIEQARTWIDTPWKHGQAVKGINGGADCLGFIYGLGIELGVKLPAKKNYSRLPVGDSLLQALASVLIEDKEVIVAPARIMAFRVLKSRRLPGQARHVGIVASSDRMIHSALDRAVCDVSLDRWKGRIVKTYKIPGITD